MVSTVPIWATTEDLLRKSSHEKAQRQSRALRAEGLGVAAVSRRCEREGRGQVVSLVFEG
jgi:hypothetical protein